jgi:hypothetical protein
MQCQALTGTCRAASEPNPATGERTVSGVRISLGEEGRRWTLVPTMLDGKVESFVALREDAAYGDNLTAVWYRKTAHADGTESWETKAFAEQDQPKAIRAVKDALALADSTDESWPVAVAPVAATAPEALVKGVLETDALAPLVADLDDPQPLVEMLEGAGWKAAWIGPLEGVAVATAEPDAVACPQDVVLAAVAKAVEVAAIDGAGSGLTALRATLAVCGVLCWPGWEITVPASPWTTPTCGAWGWAGCVNGVCTYKRGVYRSRTQTVAYENFDCTLTNTTVQVQLSVGIQEMDCQCGCTCLEGCPPFPPETGSSEILHCLIPADCEPTPGGWTDGPWLPPV